MKTTIQLVFALMMVTALTTISRAAPTHDQQKEQIRARSEQRFPEIKKYKSAGKIGETSDGLIEQVEKGGDDALAKLVSDENSDRKALYKIIAEEQSITPDEVAKHAAARNYDHLHKGEFFKDHGSWRQK